MRQSQRLLVYVVLKGLKSNMESEVIKFPNKTKIEIQQEYIEKQRKAILKQAQEIEKQRKAILEDKNAR
jgi:hypothetical protein